MIAAAYDNPIPGYGTNTVGNLRLWESKPVNEFKLDEFNEGHYVEVFLQHAALLIRLHHNHLSHQAVLDCLC